MPIFTALGTAMGATAATAAATGAAVLSSGVGAAATLGSGIAKLVGSGDKRPTLGGPGTLSGGAAQSLYQAYAQPSSSAPGLTAPPITGQGIPDLGGIQNRMQIIGQRLGLNKGGPGSPPGTLGPA